MENTDPAKKVLDDLRARILQDPTWEQTPDRTRIEAAKDDDGHPKSVLAIETGYQHGQVTFRVSENRLRRNSRWLLVTRGHNDQFIEECIAALSDLREMEGEK